MTVTIIVSASRWLNQSHREVAADRDLIAALVEAITGQEVTHA